MSAKPLEFKGRMLSLTRVRVLQADVLAMEAQLKEFARMMPQAVAGMPVILEADQAFDLGGVLACLKQVGMTPLAAVEGPLAESARTWGLPVIAPDAGGAKAPKKESAGSTAAARTPAKLITEPVRSGQQLYGSDCDLIITNTVSAGAEVIADGCVHVYGALRGRAVAGGRGDQGARIFCRRFEAELVAVAGVYAVAEQLQGDLKGKPVMVSLENGKLKFDRLEW